MYFPKTITVRTQALSLVVNVRFFVLAIVTYSYIILRAAANLNFYKTQEILILFMCKKIRDTNSPMSEHILLAQVDKTAGRADTDQDVVTKARNVQSSSQQAGAETRKYLIYLAFKKSI
ncbi:hypothetical protein POM88_043593 [Heracleum sosnowskyi]|uniref:Uncharacterized protein n=1 Tax=Heracleum sosnowskyi TaxID=360622 RepID=A0AAD8M4E3_9APIA|nr:hypothetical protein POM88_043593 [Heracleum sosnowskyi]